MKHDGSIEQIPPGIFKSTCKVSITWFPFDNQTCELKFGTWTYTEELVNLTLESTDAGSEILTTSTDDYQVNAEWELKSVIGRRNRVVYETISSQAYIDVTFEICIQRKTIYYFNNLIIPCIVIASMVIFGFQTPPDSGEKLTLCITILMSLTFFMNMVNIVVICHIKTNLTGIVNDAANK